MKTENSRKKVEFLTRLLNNSGKDTQPEKVKALLVILFVSWISIFLTGLNDIIANDHFPVSSTTALIIIPIGYFLIKNFNAYSYASLILPILGVILLPYVMTIQGGINSPITLWMPAIPIYSIFFLGRKKGLVFTIIIAIELLIFFVLDYLGHSFISVVHKTENSTFGIYIFVLLTFLAVMSLEFEGMIRSYLGQLDKSKEKLIMANASKDLFWSNISHEIRTPLNGILGMTHLLMGSHTSKEQKELLSIIKDSADGLNMILSDVMDYSKLESGEIDLEKKPVYLKSLLEEIIDQFHYAASEKDIYLNFLIDSDVPQGLLTDALRIKQIINNLVNNAIKFTENGTVKILVEKGGKKNQFRISIEDSGIGIPVTKQDWLFKPFSQIDSGFSRKYGGTGLGLVICKKLVELLGGTISVESQQDRGSTFSFTFIALPVQVKQNKIEKNKDRWSPYIIKASDIRILVAEDNLVNQKLLISLLDKNGFKADVANNGKEAVDICSQNTYDLIFMDMQMPILNGIEASKEIIKMSPGKPPKIVAVTANVLQEDKEACFEAGMDDFITKPVSNNMLISILERYTKQIRTSMDVSSSMGHPLIESDRKDESFDVKELSSKFKYIDVEELLDSYNFDLFVIKTITEQFIKNIPGLISDLEKAFEDNDIYQIEFLSHSLKGTLTNFYARDLLSQAINLEKLAKEQKVMEALTLYSTIVKSIDLFILEINELVDTLEKK